MLVVYNWLLISLLTLVAAFADLMLGAMNLFVPVFALTTFYLFVVNAWWRVLLPVTVMGVLMDAALGRTAVVSLLVVAAAVALARYWAHFGTNRRYLPLAMPGAVLGIVSWMVAQTFEAFQQGGWRALLSVDVMLTGMVQAVFVAGLAAVVCARLGDALAARLEMPTFIREVQ